MTILDDACPQTPAKPAVSWRGGPELDVHTEWEYELERADYE